MSTTLALNCWVLGSQSNDPFTVEIQKDKNISALKDAIKEKKKPTFNHIPANTLKLWPVPTAILVENNFKERVNGLDLTKPLRSVRPLAGLFAEPLEPSNLHVVIKVPNDEYHVHLTGKRSVNVVDTIKLNCWVKGDDPKQAFTVKIDGMESIGTPKAAIKDAQKPDLDHVKANTLELLKLKKPVSFDQLSTFAQSLNDLTPMDNSLATISDTFLQEALNSNQLHIFVKCPSIVSEKESVSILKDTIKEKMMPDFDRIPAGKLTLWKVSVPREGRQEVLKNCKGPQFINGAEKLDPTIRLSKLFAEPVNEHLHVVVEPPKTNLSHLDTVVANSESDRVVQKRRAYLKNIGPKAPSTAGQPKEFHQQQVNSDWLIYCSRPSHVTAVIPMTLLHPVFGQFLDDKDMLEPTVADNKLVLDFSAVMVQVYDKEEE